MSRSNMRTARGSMFVWVVLWVAVACAISSITPSGVSTSSSAGFPVIAAIGLSETGCSKSEMAQARSRENAAKPVQTEVVRQDSLRRAVDVVGTLAAVDEVTISSEAEGKVSRILAEAQAGASKFDVARAEKKLAQLQQGSQAPR